MTDSQCFLKFWLLFTFSMSNRLFSFWSAPGCPQEVMIQYQKIDVFTTVLEKTTACSHLQIRFPIYSYLQWLSLLLVYLSRCRWRWIGRTRHRSPPRNRWWREHTAAIWIARYHSALRLQMRETFSGIRKSGKIAKEINTDI